MRAPLALAAFLLPPLACLSAQEGAASRPNVLFVTIDDCSPDFACYGNELVETPHLDALAASGQRFTRCFVTTPVCSPVRSSLITGNYATTIGQHQHRSRHPLPEGWSTLPELFRDAGYRATFLPWQQVSPEEFVQDVDPEPGRFTTVTGRNKTDFNFGRDGGPPSFEAWSPAAEGPFFALIDFNSPKTPARPAHRVAELRGRTVDPARVRLAPYWADTEEVRAALARYQEGIELLDLEIGRLQDWLDREGLREDTLVFVQGDHGHAFLRAKQWCYDTGLHVPLLVTGPGIAPAVRDDLVSSIDLAAAALTACGIPLPATMEGRDFLQPGATGRDHVFASRDRCDETEDRIRAVRDDRYKLIHNHHPELPRFGRNAYTLRTFPNVAWLLAADRKALSPLQAELLSPTRPEWELYDTRDDPFEVRNLAEDPGHRETLERLRHLLEEWVARTDAGNAYPEPLVHVTPDAVRDTVSIRRYVDGAPPDLPRVMVIGDSISVGYTPFLRELLAGRAVVHHNPGNAGHTGRGLKLLEEWLGDTEWDVIHCNWGLWDLAYRPGGSKDRGLDLEGEQSWSPEEYEAHLRELMKRLKRTGARLIWASTTPVPEGSAGRYAGDEVRYNEVAARVMAEMDVPIDDLHAHALPRLEEIQRPRNVHFTPEGSRFLAEQVARSIRAALE